MEQRKQIKVKFLDYWGHFDRMVEDYLPVRILRKHYDLIICDDADYVFYSVFGDSHWAVPDSCIKIFHAGEAVSPDFNACDYAIGFDYMSFGDRYKRFPLYLFYDDPTLYRLEHKHELPEGWSLEKEKTAFCSFVVSNGHNDYRNRAFDVLSSYKRVDSGGRFRNNVGGPVPDKLAFESSHKFSICFENGSYPGYVTEKLAQALAARTVPIYWGDPLVGKVFNPACMVNAFDYPSLDELFLRVKELDQDDEKYLAMLKEPAFLPDAPSVVEELESMEKWLISIFDQPLEHAPRRNREFWGKRYVETQRNNTRRSRRYSGIVSLWRRFKNKVFYGK